MASSAAPLGHDRGPDAHVVAVGDRNDVLQYRLFVPARANSAPRAASCIGAHRNVEHRNWRLCRARKGDGDFGGAARRLGAVDRHQDARACPQAFSTSRPRDGRDGQRSVEALGEVGHAVVEFLARLATSSPAR